MDRLKTSQITQFKKELLKNQDHLCGICNIDLSDMPTRNICLDHCHATGYVRKVLCRNCNSIEGKIYNLCNRGKRNLSVSDYLLKVFYHHIAPTTSVLHPLYKTEDEKKLQRNTKARKARAVAKAKANIKVKNEYPKAN